MENGSSPGVVGRLGMFPFPSGCIDLRMRDRSLPNTIKLDLPLALLFGFG